MVYRGVMQRYNTWIIGFVMACTSCTTTNVGHADAATTPKPKIAANAADAAMERGEQFFQAQRWADAARSFETAVKAQPNNGRAWARLAASLHAGDHFAKAAVAWQKAVDIDKSPLGMYNLACAHARAGNVDEAIRWLGQSIDNGFTGASGARKDPDFAGLLTDTRFLALTEKAERLAAPCLFGAEYKQFDFWIGEWDVYTPAGQKAGENIITSASSGCLVVENWTGTRGGTGKSMNFYDPERKQWRQIWVGSGGAISEFIGEFKDGAMRFVSDTRPGQEAKTLRRLTFFHVGPNEVRQFAERSTDGGKTYSTEYDFTYKRRVTK